MKRFILAAAIIFAAGCSTVNPMDDIIRDKQFDQYRSDLDQLESQYLQKQITYAEYLDKKKIVEETYQKEIDDRRQSIQSMNGSVAPGEMAP